MPRPTRQTDETDERRLRSHASQQALLAAAAARFARAGFEGATLDAIAGDAGVNKALVRYHFGDKQGLFSRVLLDAIERGAEILAPVRSSAAPPAERLDQFIRAISGFLDEVPHFAPIISREWMCAGTHVTPEVMQRLLQFFRLDAEILEDGARHGDFRSVDTHAAHLALVGSLVFFHLSAPMRDARSGPDFPPPLTSAEFADHVRLLFRHGLADHSGDTPPGRHQRG
ncbi:MAG: TetR/AcrR family transcriptional regulator [Planctomycetota bacterium]|jgi:TetR/AcrR family transcriptional regulator